MLHQHLDDPTLRRFMVGEVSDEEREQIEALLFEDDDLFERSEAIETEVLAEHAAGLLDARQREHIQRLSLAAPEIEARKTLVGSLLSLAQAERARRSRFAAMAAGILLALGLFALGYHGNAGHEPVEAHQPVHEVPKPPQDSPRPLPKLAQHSDVVPEKVAAQKRERQRSLRSIGTTTVSSTVVDLLLSSLRDDGKPERLSLQNVKKTVVLRFIFLDPPAAQKYKLTLTDSGGRSVESWNEIQPIPVQDDRALVVDLPATKLPPGTYTASVEAIPPRADVKIMKDFEILSRNP